MNKIMAIADIHFPAQNKKLINRFVLATRKNNPDVIILNGDLLDFHTLSKFKSNMIKDDLVKQLSECRKFLRQLRFFNPEARIIYLNGNHELRLNKYLDTKAPELLSLELNIRDMLKLDNIRVELLCEIELEGFLFKHEPIKCGTNLYANLDLENRSLVTAHLHRYFDVTKGELRHIGMPCACDFDSDVMKYALNKFYWSQGWIQIYGQEVKLCK